jgi:ubiquinol-cytochrome c reductase iron-sulfur subunit
MSSHNLRRLRLRVTLKLMILLAIVVFLFMLIAALFSRPGGNIVLPLDVDLEGIAAGSFERVQWNGRRVLILHRDPAMLETLPSADQLYDPGSRFDRRPKGLSVDHRGFRPEWLVVYAESTDLGCDLELVAPGDAGGRAVGLIDRCRGGRYDFAGRVYRGQPAMRNLEVPRYRLDDSRLTLGVE